MLSSLLVFIEYALKNVVHGVCKTFMYSRNSSDGTLSNIDVELDSRICDVHILKHNPQP
jgi:hypothetical protein